MPPGRRVNSRKVVPIQVKSTAAFDHLEDEDYENNEFEDELHNEMDAFHDDMHFLDEPTKVPLNPKELAAALNGSNTDKSKLTGEGGEGGEEEEVILTHEQTEAGAKYTEALRQAFKKMKAQIEEFQKRTEDAIKKEKETQKKVYDLEDKVDLLEDEINSLNLQAQQGGGMGGQGGFRVVGGGGGGNVAVKKANNANDKLRQELQNSNDADDVDLGLTELDGTLTLMNKIKAWAAKKKPFQKDIRTIQGKFGSAVASYFVFYRFIFMQVIAITTVATIFTVLHLTLYINGDPSNSNLNKLIQGNGMLPAFMLFSTFIHEEAFQYSMFIIFGLLVFLSTAIEHLITEDKTMKRIDASEEGNEAPYSKALLCAWDFGGYGYSPTSRQVEDQCGSLKNSYIQLLEDTRTAGLINSRSRFELFVLYSRRFISTMLYIGVQAASFAAIVILTIYTEDITKWLGTTPFKNFASALAPLALNVLNSISPPLMQIITSFEKWDSGQMNLNVLLFRMYLSNILNTLILALSYLLLADPMLLAEFPTIRGSLELVESGVFQCRMDQTADAMFSLYTTNFFISNFSLFIFGKGFELFHRLLSKTQWGSDLLGEYQPFPFEVEPAMINLFNNMSLVMITFPFAPTAMIFLPMAIFISVKVEVFCMINYNSKPERTWKAHQSGVIFTSFYLATLILIGIPITIYFISTSNFPKNCSIQDSAANLCVSGTYDGTSKDSDGELTHLCTKSSTNKYYTFYENLKYPYAICSTSCGPFVEYETQLIPFKDIIFQFSALKKAWELLFDVSYIPWCVIGYMLVVKWRAHNTKIVLRETQETKEKVLTVQVEGLEAEKRRQDKIIARFKQQQAAAEEAQNLLTAR
jgi:hypothetical protein